MLMRGMVFAQFRHKKPRPLGVDSLLDRILKSVFKIGFANCTALIS